MFFYCEDDPIINRRCLNIEGVYQNPNLVIASTRYGARLCSYEHFSTIEQWLPKPAFEFLSFFRQNETSRTADLSSEGTIQVMKLPRGSFDMQETQSLSTRITRSRIEDDKSVKSVDDSNLYNINKSAKKRKIINFDS